MSAKFKGCRIGPEGRVIDVLRYLVKIVEGVALREDLVGVLNDFHLATSILGNVPSAI